MACTPQAPSFTPQQRAGESGCHPPGPAGTAGADLAVRGAPRQQAGGVPECKVLTRKVNQEMGLSARGRHTRWKVLRQEGRALAGRQLCAGPDEQEVWAQTETRAAQSTRRLPGVRRPLEFPSGKRADLTQGRQTQEAPVLPHCLPPAKQAGGRPQEGTGTL